MEIVNKEMYVTRRKGTNEYMRNNKYFRELDDETCTSAVRLYETKNLAKSAIPSRFHDDYDFLKVQVSINIVE